jgi:hypothetical protein
MQQRFYVNPQAQGGLTPWPTSLILEVRDFCSFLAFKSSFIGWTRLLISTNFEHLILVNNSHINFGTFKVPFQP